MGVKGKRVMKNIQINSRHRTVERGVSVVGGPGPAEVIFNEKFDCSLGSGAMKYPVVRTGSQRPWILSWQGQLI